MSGAAYSMRQPSLVAFAAGARVGVEVDAVLADGLDGSGMPCSMLASSPHRVRLVRERLSPERIRLGVIERIADIGISVARAERLDDEASRALELLAALGAGNGIAELPLATAEQIEASRLSLWIGARLPLSARLHAGLLSCTCPLTRMRDVVDAMRLLAEPSPRRARPGHRFKLREEGSGGDARLILDASAN